MGLNAQRAPTVVRGAGSLARRQPREGTWWRARAGVLSRELRAHAPYTLLGTLGGLVLLVALAASGAPRSVSQTLFWTLHPLHVFLSAWVTAGVFLQHRRVGRLATLVVGYVGSVGIATLSDSLIPFVGECSLGFPHRAVHLGFLEKWWLVNPLAVTGTLFAMWRRWTKFPHAGHVWLSTWASLFHMTMASDGYSLFALMIVPGVLFLAVWIPCCTSDIVFPLLFVPCAATVEPSRSAHCAAADRQANRSDQRSA